MPGLSRYFNKKFFVLVNYSSEDGNEDFKEVIENLKKNNEADLVTKICDEYSKRYETDEKGSK